LDQCPTTAEGREVNAEGCEPDGDNDGVADRLDRCPTSAAGEKVDSTGCGKPDADKDSVEDKNDACPNTAIGASVNELGCSELQNISLEGVNFRTGSAQLLPVSLPILDEAARKLNRFPSIRVEVAGHTDSDGRAASNQRLSQRRSESVRTYLISKGVRSANLTAKGYGETTPVASNSTRAGKAQNRRVELKILR